ncbi:hypothetical protein KFL_001510130 [Klebsormidium nitens]|uniref:START domain-containing protein n=1 Tax=Klebsormidium nitens TaxID=105231 RepID=A0A1Y1HXW3_KLENI|nr:hypothetical protein KFL_001510130 [Klebsormidium nitens]|eukprot:GAQ83510.1 hypothetical protein KFL_001510130 [Klebsormidium nitens]
MEGEVLVILENDLAGGPAQVTKRYLVLKGRRFEVFPDKPREGEKPTSVGLLGPDIRVKQGTRETVAGQKLFTFVLSSTLATKKETKLGTKAGKDAVKWIQAITASVEGSLQRSESWKLASPDDAVAVKIGEVDIVAQVAWRLYKCENGLRFFEETSAQGSAPRQRVTKVLGVVEASTEAVFNLVMDLGTTRTEWDTTFVGGGLVEQVDDHVDILHQLLEYRKQTWDLCLTRYWRYQTDGSYVVFYESTKHKACKPRWGTQRISLESGGLSISPLQSPTGSPRALVEYTLELETGASPHFGSGFGSWQQSVTAYPEGLRNALLGQIAGIRDYYASRSRPRVDVRHDSPVKGVLELLAPKKRFLDLRFPSAAEGDKLSSTPVLEVNGANRIDEEEEELEEFYDAFQDMSSSSTSTTPEGSPRDPGLWQPVERAPIDWSAFRGNLEQGPKEKGKNCYSDPDMEVFLLRGMTYFQDRKKIPAGEPLLRLAAVDWLRSTARIDRIAQRPNNAVMQAASKVDDLFAMIINMQLPGKTQYSMVFYFVCTLDDIEPGSVLDGFIKGSDAHRNKRFKFTPRIAEGSWLIRQAVGEHSVTVADALGVTYSSGKNYLEVDVNIGSSPIASSVFGLVMGVITNVVIDFAYVLEAVTEDELPEELLGAVRLSRLQFSSAVQVDPL